MKKFMTSLLLLSAATFGLSATAEQLTAVGGAVNCQNGEAGEQHTKFHDALSAAAKSAREKARNRLKENCEGREGVLTINCQPDANCFQTEQSIDYVQGGRVCVACDSTVGGDCA